MKTNKNANKASAIEPKISFKLPTWLLLALKLTFLLAVMVSVIVYTDKKGLFEPDQSNNHTERKWNSFYDLTPKDTVDVVLIGNSHCYAGVNPKNLSAALGATCFVLASPGTSIMDSYFCLEEALQRTHPTVAIIETYGISNTINHKLDKQGLSNQFKSFYARKNLRLKLASMPDLFPLEYYAAAWSNTIRNHDFIFHDRKQISTNRQLRKIKKKKEQKLYLGRFVSFTSGIEDSIMAKYDSLGAPVDGSLREVNEENICYVNKIIDLCQQHEVIPVFLTLPMYYRHVKHYPDWKKTIASVIEPTGAAWLDLQEPYDTAVFDRDCFENTFAQNQHMTYIGSVRGAYKIAHFLTDSLHIQLPKRRASKHWNDMFYGEEGYFENYPSRPNDKANVLVCKNMIFGDIEVADCLMLKGENSNMVLLKIKKKGHRRLADRLQVAAAITFKGQQVITNLEFVRRKDYDPLTHDLYAFVLVKDAEMLGLVNIKTP